MLVEMYEIVMLEIKFCILKSIIQIIYVLIFLKLKLRNTNILTISYEKIMLRNNNV